jgi:hypothetical protein
LAELAEWVESAVLAELAAWVASAASVARAEPAVSVEWVESVEWAASAVPASQEVPVVPAALAESVVPVARVESVGPAAPEVPASPAPAVPRARAEWVAGIARGITTPSIAAARPMETARRRTVLAAARAAHPLPRAKQEHASKSAIRAEILPVTVTAAAVPA